MGNKGSKKAKDKGKQSQEPEKKVSQEREPSIPDEPAKFPENKKEGDEVNLECFQKMKIIGKGAFGEVWIVKKIKGDKKGAVFALKQMSKLHLQNNQLPRLIAERDLMAFADHKYVIALHYSFQDDKNLYLVMDFMQGGDLMQLLIKQDIFGKEETKFYMAELCLAVHSIHALGYVHRDLKPDNILLSDKGHVKLADFGLAKKMTSKKITEKLREKGEPLKDEEKADTSSLASTKTEEEKRKTWKQRKRVLMHSIVGTPDYMAPEVFDDMGYNEECDWWGVGAIMFECLAGYAPFYDRDGNPEGDPRIVIRHVQDWKNTFHIPKHLDKEAADLLSKLIRGPGDRLNFSQIKEHPFFKGIDWDNMDKAAAPYAQVYESKMDTKSFDYAPDEHEEEEHEEYLGGAAKSFKVEDFTFYLKDNKKKHNITDLWLQKDDDGAEESDSGNSV